MPFPDTQRVIYKNATLTEVICQLRFPPVLKISSGEPADFQDLIRNEFPNYVERSSDLPPDIPPEILKSLPIQFKQSAAASVFDFVSEDGAWRVSLNREFLALSTTAYIRWEEFRKKLATPLEALNKVYSPSTYSRIGLRYKDLIVRSRIGLQEVPWSALLNPVIAGELADPHISGNVLGANKELSVRLEDGLGKVTVRHNLAKLEESGEEVYVIDADFYKESRTEIKDATETLNRINKYGGKLFRWCISERLYNALGPEPAD